MRHRELLRGPLFYVLTMSVVTMLYWRTSPVGVCALALMCGGDGAHTLCSRAPVCWRCRMSELPSCGSHLVMRWLGLTGFADIVGRKFGHTHKVRQAVSETTRSVRSGDHTCRLTGWAVVG